MALYLTDGSSNIGPSCGVYICTSFLKFSKYNIKNRAVSLLALISVRNFYEHCTFEWNCSDCIYIHFINPFKPNDPYRCRTAPLTSKLCILYIYSTNIGTEYFKHGIYSPFFFLFKINFFHNSNLFGSCIIHILYTGCAKI